MAIRQLVILPDKLLRLVCEPVTKFDAALKALTDDMFDTMYDAPGIGLAAVQIGVLQRVVTLDLAKKEEDPKEPMILINPEILWSSTETSVYEEGCLSIPDYYEEVIRPKSIRVAYQDLTGARHEVLAEGLLATCVQHEVDHLNGKLFIDHISKLKRDRCIKKFTKLAQRGHVPSAGAEA